MNWHWLLALTLVLATAQEVLAVDVEQPPIEYSKATPENAIRDLVTRLESRKVELAADVERGYLPALLESLEIPVSSQVLVFSKTSLQRHRITPKTPRAIYFSDEVVVGYCHQGDVLEIAASDGRLGTAFYALEQRTDQPPQFTRQTESCLICHAGTSNQGFPGHLMRSVGVNRRGDLVLGTDSHQVDHRTPLADRWGGWYVTGDSGGQPHRGNQVTGGWPFADGREPIDSARVKDLSPYFTVGNYLSPHSDLVALLVLEHQAEAHNRLARVNYLARLAADQPADAAAAARLQTAIEDLVAYLFFADEAPLAAPIHGTSTFAADFAARGPRDAKQRSLRDFDLQTRLFRHPLSYIIYTRAFDALPPTVLQSIYRRFKDVLTGVDADPRFAHLSAADRQAIGEIVRATKGNLPGDWWE